MDNKARKLDTSCLDGQICVNSSEWLAENIKGMDQSVEEMMQLVEYSEDSQADNVDSNENNNHSKKQPELIAIIKEILHRHHILADHYNMLTGELRQHKAAKNSEEKTSDAQLTPPFMTPMNKVRVDDNLDGQLLTSDSSPSSGFGTSYVTPNERSKSSSSSDSDSDTDDASLNERLSLAPSRKMLEQEAARFRLDYEKKLSITNEKLQSTEEEVTKLKRELEDNERVMMNLGGIEAELLAAKNKINLHEAEAEKENERSLALQMKIVDLEGELKLEKEKVDKLHKTVKTCTADLSNRDVRIQELNDELQDVSENFAFEKSQLESSVSKLTERFILHEVETKEFQMQCELLANEIKELQAGKIKSEKNQEAARINWQDEMDHLHINLSKNTALIDALNENLDGLKLRSHMLMVEKDDANAKLHALVAERSCREDCIERLEHDLHRLECENERLSSVAENAKKQMGEMKSRLDGVEKEVQMQAVVISEMAEEKREAIRQLCFSIDHFRCAYEELRNRYVSAKRPAAVVP